MTADGPADRQTCAFMCADWSTRSTTVYCLCVYRSAFEYVRAHTRHNVCDISMR